jgi:hypothetical protein
VSGEANHRRDPVTVPAILNRSSSSNGPSKNPRSQVGRQVKYLMGNKTSDGECMKFQFSSAPISLYTIVAGVVAKIQKTVSPDGNGFV